MKSVSRRQLLQYSTGTLTAGAGFVMTGGASTPSSPTLAGPGDSYKLLPDTDSQERFGKVRDFRHHIQGRPDIKKEVLYWLTDGRASFLGAASRFQFLEPMIRPMYEAVGIPMAFGFGLGMQESLFRNYSVSYASAKGIWQMQWAGKKYGLRGGDYFDIIKSTEKQLDYLKDLVRVFDWNLELVLVDYNYGPGKKFARYRSDPNAFQRICHRLPGQTRRFVPRVLAAIAIGLDAERYGVHIPLEDSRTVDVPVPRDIHHLELGLLLDTDHWNLGNLNPRENVRVWFEENETIRIPRAHEAEFQQRVCTHPLRKAFHEFVAAVYPTPGESIRYTVETGDNLADIAGRFRHCGVTGSDHLMLYNGLTSTVIRPGQELVIPCIE
jgi:membrane-bound lytic murein transglycosylase D